MNHLNENRPMGLNLKNADGLKGLMLRGAALLVLLAFATPHTLRAQTANGYVIYCDDYDLFLVHDASTGALNTTGVGTFDPATCLWSVGSNYIRPTSDDGSTVLNNQYLSHASNTLGTDNSTTSAAWTSAAANGQPYYSGGYYSNYYLRVTGSTTWQVGTSNSHRGTIYAVSTTTTENAVAEAYNGTLGGTTTLIGAGATDTYIPSVTRTAAHTATTVTYSYSGGTLGESITGAPSPTVVSIASGWNLVWSLSDDTYATISDAGVVTVSSTLPATYATTTVTLTATKTDGTGSFTASLPVTIFASAEVYENIVGGTPGVSGGVVTLNDYEYHSWNYYSDTTLPERLRSLNPANVKITYYGYGDNTVTTTSTADNPANSAFDGDVASGDVAVSHSESENTFVYYKTLENAQADGSTNRYPYELIPNPFSKRPTSTDNGSVTITPATRDIYVNWYRTNSGTGTLEINYTDANGQAATFGQTINGTGNTTLSVKAGTSVSYTLTRTSSGNNRSVSFTARYDNSAGTEIWNNITANSGTARTGTLSPVAFGSDVTLSRGIYRGFYAWRVKSLSSGLSIKVGSTTYTSSDIATGIIIDAEEEVEFITENEYNNEVAFEALWAQAYVVTSTATAMYSGVSYERNFTIITSDDNSTNVFSCSTPCTYSSFYPNGTINGTTAATTASTRYTRQAGTASVDSKVEYIIFNGGTLNTGGHKVTIGRGVTSSSNPTITPLSGTFSAAADARLRIESGAYGGTTNLYGTPSVGGNLVHLDLILGSDYDRATNDNSKLSISQAGTIQHGAHTATGNSWLSFQHLDIIVKSGEIQKDYWNDASAKYDRTFYCRSTLENNGRYPGITYLTVEGGEFASINGGRGNYAESVALVDDIVFSLRIKGGTVHGSIYGAASANPSFGGRRVVMTGGMVEGWIAGGCDGISNGGGATVGDSYFYIGGNAKVGNPDNPDRKLDGTFGGNIFGAGRGMSNHGTSANPASMRNAYIAVADNGFVLRSVYGGGDYGYTGVIDGDGNTSSATAANFYILGGTVNENVFGGGNQNNSACTNADILMTGGLVKGGIYGGSNVRGTMEYDVNININGGTVGADAEHPASVFGGGLGADTRVLGDVNLTVGATGAATGVVVNGDVYGGSALGRVNGNTALTSGAETHVTLNAGTIHGSVYGGGLGQKDGVNGATSDVEAIVYGPVQVDVYGGTVDGAVYGCNNLNGAPQSTVNVDIYGTDPHPGTGSDYALNAVYGGGNQADYSSTPTVTVHGDCTGTNADISVGEVYGGGNQADVTGTLVNVYGGDTIGDVYAGANRADVSGNAVLNVYGGTIKRVFPGNNNSGSITGSVTTTINANVVEAGKTHCPMQIGAVFGGGNKVESPARAVDIVCTGDATEGIDTLFGGANQANITTDITLSVGSGHIREGIFGGNNTSGTVQGDITVNITDNGTCSFPYPTVFGGGYGQLTETTGGVTINIGEKTSTATAPTIHGTFYNGTIFRGAVFGGSALGSVNDNTSDATTINIYNGTIVGDIFGGGLGDKANVSTLDPNVTSSGHSDVAAVVNGTVTVNIGTEDQTDANCASDLTQCAVYGCNNINGSPQGDVNVHIWRTGHITTNEAAYTAADATYAIDEVFGGGNNANYAPANDNRAQVYVHTCNNTIRRLFGGGNAADATTISTIIDGGRYDWVFGGGNGEVTAANVTNGASLDVNAGYINHLFGGSNERGTISGTWTVDVSHSNESCTELIKEFFGGGNLAVLGTPADSINLATTIQCGAIFGDVYGGSNKADIIGNVTLTVNGGTMDNVYAGSKGVAVGDPEASEGISADIKGNVTLNIHGGTIGRAYGGSNINGNIEGLITVNLDWDQYHGCDNEKSLGYIYGASNLTQYNPSLASIIGADKYAPVVNLIDGTVDHNVFGGGRGSETDYGAGLVTTNPKVEMGSSSSAHVLGNIYGGGEMASVGLLTRDGNGIVSAATANYGDPWVDIQGGTVGPDNLNPSAADGGGNVFGGGLGKPSVNGGTSYAAYAYCNNTKVTVGGSAAVRGSVFGGSESGHVYGNTDVAISGGTVGVRIPLGYRNYDPDGTSGVVNRIYAGNVYGGGRGVAHNGDFSQTAGRVYGNTNVTISGTATVRHSVYGGGSLASVGTYSLTPDATIFGGQTHTFTRGGTATVTVSGGRIGPKWEDLEVDAEGNALLASTTALNSSYAHGGANGARDTLINNYRFLGENEGMVYGSGRGVNYDFNETDLYDHSDYIDLAFVNQTIVTINGTADVVGSVFGGGENGHVKGNTQVNIAGGTVGGMRLHHNGFYLRGNTSMLFVEDNDEGDDELNYGLSGVGINVFRGNVYGGGRGVDHTAVTSGTVQSANQKKIFSISAGRVYGNTVVNITGGTVYHNVFGGGSIASVGTYHYPALEVGDEGYPGYNFLNAGPSDAVANTGATQVNVSGGQVGVMGENEGGVYGGGRGISGASESQVTHLAFVNSTEVNITSDNSTHADVRGSVFGGGMNGHVLANTEVNVSGGVIGGKTDADYGSWDTEYFPLNGTNTAGVYIGKPASADTTIHGTAYYSGIHANDTITTNDGTGPRTVFLGNVYGGGRGVDTYDGTHNSYTAGRVYGNTVVNITGGLIYHSVFGGGSIASVGTYTTYTAAEAAADAAQTDKYRITEHQPKSIVSGGKATVTVSGGRIGTNGRNNGRVFGSSRGMAGVNYRGLGYVNIAHVNIEDGSIVRGSVFGSGENGHVLDSTLVTVSGGHIGNGLRTGDDAWINHYVGNVYGGGRGLDREDPAQAASVSPFAGRVYRTANVVITGGVIDHSVYGGGSLASVGRYKRNASNEITYADADNQTGTARVTISGGTIGRDGKENGHVFGASRGTASTSSDIRASLAYVNHTVVKVTDGTIKGSVFGGGESGHVQADARVSVSGGSIGSAIPNDYNTCTAAEKAQYDLMGNVYGGGRGIDEITVGGNKGFSMSAGYVRGRTFVTISGTPTIHRNVYGGGSMGTVGDYGPYGRQDYWMDGTVDPATFVRGAATDVPAYNSASNGVATVVINGPVGTAADIANHYGGNVYGSCRGQANNPTQAAQAAYEEFYEDGGFADMAYTAGTHVIIETGAHVLGNVYGGGESGHVDFGGTMVDILNGTVDGDIFGGGRGATTSPTAGIVDGPTQVNIGSPSQASNTVVVGGYVFGGNDTYSSPLGEMRVDVYRTAHTDSPDNRFPVGLSSASTLTDSEKEALKESLMTEAEASTASRYALKAVYGGGNLASTLTGVLATDAPGWTSLSDEFNSKYINQRITGTAAGIPAYFTPWPGGTSRKSIVYIHECDENTVMMVYGGGRAANTLENVVNIEGGRIYQVYAGGDGSTPGTSADVGYASTMPAVIEGNGDATVTVEGGIVYQIFGGSNTSGVVNGKARVSLEPTNSCELVNNDLFGGGNRAPGLDVEVTIPCGTKGVSTVYGGGNAAQVRNITLNIEGGEMKKVFGGCRNADVTGNIEVNVYGGTIGELFGGNDQGGNIEGTVTVTVDWGLNTCVDPLRLGYVYGAGNLAPYAPTLSGYGPVTDPAVTVEHFSPVVNIIQAIVDSAVFGGGYGVGNTSTADDAHVDANPLVVIGAYRVKDHDGNTVDEPNNEVRIGRAKNPIGRTLAGDVFGGGNAGPVNGSPKVIIQGSNTLVYNNIYGGGNAATVVGNPDVVVGPNPRLSAPAFSLEGDQLTMTSHEGATIHYTIDGSTPDASSTEYSAAITATTGSTVKAIAVMDGLANSNVRTITTLATPVISLDGATATVTCATAGASLRYTTDGSTPTASSTLYSGPVTLSNGQTLKVIAVKDGWFPSEVASETYSE